jgi:redox-sensitive bicupin YhaK (pirin superfamily)
MSAAKTLSIRTVTRVADSVRVLEGGGFEVRRPFPTRALDHVDPFLLLDEMGPVDYAPGEAKGAPAHPHRGFETVTYLLAGELEHRDSAGHRGRLSAGGVQWMTAGAGVIHEELPTAEVQRQGGRAHGFQLWVNLPRRDKMMAPRYQEIAAAELPVATSPDFRVTVKVIAGEAMGVRAAIDTRTPIVYLHVTVRPGGELVHPLPPDLSAMAYVFRGGGRFGAEGRTATEGQLVMFGPHGSAVVIASLPETEETLELLLLAGAPLQEPVVRHGPFVMNTGAEIAQAIDDFRSGRMGKLEE